MKKIKYLLTFLLFSSAAFGAIISTRPDIIQNIVNATITSSLKLNDDVQAKFGTSSDFVCEYDTNQTPDAFICGASSDSNNVILTEKADISTDYAHAASTNVNFFIHGSDETDVNDWLGFKHNQTDAIISTGSGDLLLNLSGGNLAPSANDGFALGSSSNQISDLYLASGSNVVFDADATITHSANLLTFSVGGGSRFSIGTNVNVSSTTNFQNSTADGYRLVGGSVTSGLALTKRDDIDTGFGFGTANEATITTGGSVRLTVDGTAAVFTNAISVGGDTVLGNAVTDNVTITSAIQGSMIFDGATNDTNEITLAIADPGADYTVTLPAATGNLVVRSEGTYDATLTLVGGAGNTVSQYSTDNAYYWADGTRVCVDIYKTGDGGNEGAGTGQFFVELPFAASATSFDEGFPVGNGANSATYYMLDGAIQPGTSTMRLREWSSFTALGDFTGDDQNNTARLIRLHFCYKRDV